jgi:hypothetical protein
VLLRPDAPELTAAEESDGHLLGVVEEVTDPGPIVRARVRLDGGERLTVTRPRRAG